jgi:hypothetical protein
MTHCSFRKYGEARVCCGVIGDKTSEQAVLQVGSSSKALGRGTEKSYCQLYEETNKCTYKSYTLFIDHSYMFRSPSVAILRVRCITNYNKKTLCGKSVQDLNL